MTNTHCDFRHLFSYKVMSIGYTFTFQHVLFSKFYNFFTFRENEFCIQYFFHVQIRMLILIEYQIIYWYLASIQVLRLYLPF